MKDRHATLNRTLTTLRLVGDYPRSTPAELADHLRCREDINVHPRTVKRMLHALQRQNLVSEVFIAGVSVGWRANYHLTPNPAPV